MSPTYLLWFKRLAIIGGSTLVVLYLLALILEDRVGGIVMDLAREEITTELEVGETKLSFIRAFPKIRVSLHDVVLTDTHKDTLLQCGTIGVNLGWSVLWASTPSLDALLLEDGFLRLALDKKGKPNYLVFVEPDPDEPKSSLAFDIRKASLINMDISWNDGQSGTFLQMKSHNSTLSGRIREVEFGIDHALDASIVSLKTSSIERFANLPFKTKGTLQIDLEKEKYVLDDTWISLADLVFDTKGYWETTEKGKFIDLSGETETLNLKNLWPNLQRLLPETAQQLEPAGDFAVTFEVKGFLKGDKMPGMDAEVLWNKGRIKLPSGPDLQDIAMDLQWHQPNGKTLQHSSFTVKKGTAEVDGHPLAFVGTLTNITQPYLDMTIDGALPAALIRSADFYGESGLIHLDNIQLKGPLTRAGFKASGQLRPDMVVFKYHQDPIRIDQGTFTLNDNRLEISESIVGLEQADFKINGYANGFADQFRVLTAPALLQFDGTIHVASLDVEALMLQFKNWQEKGAAPSKSPTPENASPDFAFKLIKGQLQTEIGSFTYGAVKGRDFTGSIDLHPKGMIISGDALSMGGSFNLEGELHWKDNTQWEGSLSCEGVNVHEAFTQTNNFGQSFITKDHLKGRLSAQVLFDAAWDSRGAFMPEKLHVYSALQIDNGELVGLDVLESFSDYIHTKDLKHVRFSTLQNYLEVDRGKVYLPRMLIQTNAVGLDITGLHGFDQSIDYGLRVDAGQVLMNKITRHDPTLQPKANKRSGWFNLFYTIKGNVDKYVIKPDRGQVKDAFARSQQHRARIRQALESEFGTILFTESNSEEELAETREGTKSFIELLTTPTTPTTRTNGSTTTSQKADPEYLDDFEIIGGSGKKKQ